MCAHSGLSNIYYCVKRIKSALASIIIYSKTLNKTNDCQRIALPASQSPTPPQKIAMPNHWCNFPTAANARALPKPKPATWPKFCGDGTSQQTVGDKGTHLKVCVPVCPQILLFLCRIGDKVTKSDCPRLSLLSPSVPLYKFTVILPPKISSSPPDSWRWRRFHRSP